MSIWETAIRWWMVIKNGGCYHWLDPIVSGAKKVDDGDIFLFAQWMSSAHCTRGCWERAGSLFVLVYTQRRTTTSSEMISFIAPLVLVCSPEALVPFLCLSFNEEMLLSPDKNTVLCFFVMLNPAPGHSLFFLRGHRFGFAYCNRLKVNKMGRFRDGSVKYQAWDRSEPAALEG